MMNGVFFKEQIVLFLRQEYGKSVEEASKEEIFYAVARVVRNSFIEKWRKTQRNNFKKGVKQAYYLSAEYLTGRFFSNNILNLQIDGPLKEALSELKIEMDKLEEIEVDAGLGNGGLGRLAACFLDSAATQKYPLHGYGIRYKYGIFKQEIENGFQVETPNKWLYFGTPWEIRRPDEQVEVRFGGKVDVNFKAGGSHFVQHGYETIIATPYDYPVIGFGGDVVNTLRLWDSESPNYFDLALFNNGDYTASVAEQNRAKNITKVLYPNDNHYEGKILRLRQQYFFVSASVQDLIRRYKKYVSTDFSKLPEYIVMQLNDTHPVLAIPEFMRVLVDNEDVEWDEAWDIAQKCFAYTNHTLMQEALEKWSIDIFRSLLPRVYQIIEEINRRLILKLQMKFPNDYQRYHKMSILGDGLVKMAYLAIDGSFSVNGVAELHSNLLKTEVLNDWYLFYPKKFNNKTNGVTQRRWLHHCNPQLAELISSKIGDNWITNLEELRKLIPFATDSDFQKRFMDIKRENKKHLAVHIKEEHGVDVNVDSIFDVQVKRLHEYKRQLLNVLHIIYLYNKIKENPEANTTPRTFIFGAKAASGYYRAKLIIKLINSVADKINNDPLMKNKLNVFFLKNYSVSLAEKIMPAADVSEQISTASTEASGTGNMKFMMNGALTLGILDGANIEIVEEVGEEHAFIFGLHSEEVLALNKKNSYNPWDIYNANPEIRKILDQLKNNYFSPDYLGIFEQLWASLMYGVDGGKADVYYVLKDFASYAEAQEKIGLYYKDSSNWAKSAILNVACSGKFSSDRTIDEYAQEIWKIKKISE